MSYRWAEGLGVVLKSRSPRGQWMSTVLISRFSKQAHISMHAGWRADSRTQHDLGCSVLSVEHAEVTEKIAV